jgi:ubiquinone/menaquinone biosynthesis C-methylase UbiE
MTRRREVVKRLGRAAMAVWAVPRSVLAGTEEVGGAMTNDTPPAGWQLAGDSAEAYERYLVPVIFTGMAERLLDLAEVRPGERLLDVGCGTGIVARTAAARMGAAGRVTGLDLNDGMLRVARRLGPGIEWRQGDALALPFADGAFDAVASQQMLQFVPDPARALREMRRVTARGGRVVAAVLRPIEFTPAYVPLADALTRHAGPEAGAMMRSPFPDYDRERLRALFRSAGFTDVHVRILVAAERYPSPSEMLRQEAASSPLAGPLSALPAAKRDALVREIESTLARHRDDAGVAFPMETFLVRARG